MPFAVTWMRLEIINTKRNKSETERQISYDITYTWNLKNNTNAFIYETETESWTSQRTDCWLPGRRRFGKDQLGGWG